MMIREDRFRKCKSCGKVCVGFRCRECYERDRPVDWGVKE